MTESAQQIAKRILADLDTLVGQGRLQATQVGVLRSDLGTIANPPAPPVIARRPTSTQVQRKKYRAIWAYKGAQGDELTFVEDARIELVEEVSEGWWRGCVVRSDGTKSNEGMFPSNYVESIPDDVPTTSKPFSPPLPPRYSGPQDSNDEKNAGGLHANAYQPAPWQPGVARWSSGGAPLPPPSPNHFNSSSKDDYYNQPPMPYGANTPNAYGPGPSPNNSVNGLQPVALTEEDKKKHEKMKKFAGRMGHTMAGGFAGGVGFGIGSHLF